MMAAYQCLNCEQIERGEEDCCGKPDLFCINDMPGEIRRLRALAAQAAELAICRNALEECLDIVGALDCMSDADEACQRVTLRRLNEAIGKAAPRLLHERPEGQKLYGLHYREQAAEIAKLRTVMVAAAEEIQAHWDAHCDADGYGPANLMRRLEEGIAVEYGYTAGAFAKQAAELAALRARVAELEGALRWLMAWFPDERDMRRAMWSPTTIRSALGAHAAARNTLEKK